MMMMWLWLSPPLFFFHLRICVENGTELWSVVLSILFFWSSWIELRGTGRWRWTGRDVECCSCLVVNEFVWGRDGTVCLPACPTLMRVLWVRCLVALAATHWIASKLEIMSILMEWGRAVGAELQLLAGCESGDGRVPYQFFLNGYEFYWLFGMSIPEIFSNPEPLKCWRGVLLLPMPRTLFWRFLLVRRVN